MIRIIGTCFSWLFTGKLAVLLWFFFSVHAEDGHLRNSFVSSKEDSKGVSFSSIQSVTEQSCKCYLKNFGCRLSSASRVSLKDPSVQVSLPLGSNGTFQRWEVSRSSRVCFWRGLCDLSSSLSPFLSLKDDLFHYRQQGQMTVDQNPEAVR